MLTELYWIPTPYAGRLAIAPRPRGGDWLNDEIRGWHEAGIESVVSLLMPDETVELELEEESTAGEQRGMRFLTFPIPDRDVPASGSAFRELVSTVSSELSVGRNVAVHCRQGIGRAGLVAASVLIASGRDVDEAVTQVGAARGRPIPETPAQRRWLDRFAAELHNV